MPFDGAGWRDPRPERGPDVPPRPRQATDLVLFLALMADAGCLLLIVAAIGALLHWLFGVQFKIS